VWLTRTYTGDEFGVQALHGIAHNAEIQHYADVFENDLPNIAPNGPSQYAAGWMRQSFARFSDSPVVAGGPRIIGYTGDHVSNSVMRVPPTQSTWISDGEWGILANAGSKRPPQAAARIRSAGEVGEVLVVSGSIAPGGTTGTLERAFHAPGAV